MTNIPPTEEKILLSRLREGDEHAFTVLYRSYVNMVFRRIKRVVHVHDIAEELTQDVFYYIWAQRQKIQPDTPFVAVVIQSAKSIAINFYQKAIREHELREALIIAGSEAYNPVEEEVLYNETQALITAVVAKLPPQRQLVFTKCKLEGRRYEDVAAELGVSVGTIKDHMAKAMRFIKQELTSRTGNTAIYSVLLTMLLR